ncbi:N-acetyltransferase family protein [Microbacterium gorillae]|uniref:GNAT family N-acetyltransferase n=1 Tax=Microbacterium gorillae TaxID=1231063 RepID=UPI003D996150
MTPSPAVTVRPMVASDWDWIQQWFQDPVLNDELGPVDTDWRDHVLADRGGIELVAVPADAPVALIGCVWDPAGAEHGVTDVAIHPARRGEGWGRSALAAALRWPGHPAARQWVAYVDPDNAAAFGFFSALGWRFEGRDDLMERFTLPSPNGTEPAFWEGFALR